MATRTEAISDASLSDRNQSDINDLVQKAYKAIREGVPANVSGIATDLKGLGRPKEAVELMRSAVESAQEQNIKFFLEQQLIIDFLDDGGSGDRPRPGSSSGSCFCTTQFDPGFLSDSPEDLRARGVRHAKGLLENDWAADVPLAGEMMVQTYLANRDEAHAEETLRKLISLPLLNEGVLARLQTELIGLNEPRLAVAVIQEQIRRNKDDLRLRFALCSQLWAHG